jgi:hypothetical protein
MLVSDLSSLIVDFAASLIEVYLRSRVTERKSNTNQSDGILPPTRHRAHERSRDWWRKAVASLTELMINSQQQKSLAGDGELGFRYCSVAPASA